MNTLNGSCSKVILDQHLEKGSSSSRDVINAPKRLEFPNIAGNSGFLNLVSVRHKIVRPLHSLTPKNQAEFNYAEIQAPPTSESKTVHVIFQMLKKCMFGEQFFLVGDDPMCGLWEPSNAIPMTWSDGHIWTVELDVPVGKSFQFKFILLQKGGNVLWQPGKDRSIETWETRNAIIVSEDWDNASLQIIKEDEELAYKPEETSIDSGMLIADEILTASMVNTNEFGQGIIDRISHHPKELVAAPNFEQNYDGNSSPSVDKPIAIVTENINRMEDSLVNARKEMPSIKIVTHLNEKSKNISDKDVMVTSNILGDNERAASVKNTRSTVTEAKIFDHKDGPVLVPGLTQSVFPTEEAGPHEVDQQKFAIDTSVGVYDSENHNMPEVKLGREEGSDDDTLEETKVFNIEELFDDDFQRKTHLAAKARPVPESANNNILGNDFQWGRQTFQKFLTNLGFFLYITL